MTHLYRLAVGTVLVAGFSSVTVRAAARPTAPCFQADTVVQVNVRQILDSDITKKYALEQLKQFLDGNDAKKIMSELGLDPLKDIDQLVIGSSGASKEDMKGMIIIHGKFNVDKLTKAAEVQTKRDADKFSKIVEGNTTIYKGLIDGLEQPFYATIWDTKKIPLLRLSRKK